jgi:hypothetical protein
MTMQLDVKLSKVRGYLFRNPHAVFVAGFQALVLTCASLLIEGSSAGDEVALLAYCSLVVGLVLCAVTSVRDKALREGV